MTIVRRKTEGAGLIEFPDAEGSFYATKSGWLKSMDQDISAVTISEDSTIDIHNHGLFHIQTKNGGITLTVPDVDNSNYSKIIVFIINGNLGAVNFIGNITWGKDGQPTLANGFTVVNLLWDKVENRWVGSCGNKGEV